MLHNCGTGENFYDMEDFTRNPYSPSSVNAILTINLFFLLRKQLYIPFFPTFYHECVSNLIKGIFCMFGPNYRIFVFDYSYVLH